MSKKGSVLMVSLWVLAILVVFALAMGQRAGSNLKLAAIGRNRLKAEYLAKAGINRAIAELDKDQKDQSRQYDSLGESWAKGFPDTEIVDNSGEKFNVQITDEDRKININKAEDDILFKVFLEAGIENPQDFKTKLKEIGEELKVPEELLLALESYYGKANPEKIKEAYDKLRELTTVYESVGEVNINTAPPEVLLILAEAKQEGCEGECGPSKDLVGEIISFRSTAPFEENTDFQPKDGNLYNLIKTYLGFTSNCFRIESSAYAGRVNKKIIAVYGRADGRFVYWHEK
jgi:type II secretory pathway component PulK